MALRDYYRCKKCDEKIAYGPDRPEADWEPFLLCRSCLRLLEHEERRLRLQVDALRRRVEEEREISEYRGERNRHLEKQLSSAAPRDRV